MNTLTKIFTKLRSLNWTIWVFLIAAFIMGLLIPRGTDEITHNTSTVRDEQAEVWTCSMHPQVKLPEPGQCPICFMDLIPLESGPQDISEVQLQLSEAAIALAEISTTLVKRAPAEREVRLSGKLAYDETKIRRMSAWMPGRLDRLFVDYTGTSVQKGEHLFEIYSPELYGAQEELIQASDQLRRMGSANNVSRRTFEATLAAAREKLKLLGLNAKQIRSIESKGSASATQTVYSPISGVVLEKSALEGGYVNTGTPIYTIADLNQLWVILDAYESDLTWLNYGQKVVFEAEAHPGREFESIISFIDPTLDERTRTVRVRANIKNDDGLLKPGMFVRAKVRSTLDAQGQVISSELAGKWVGPMHPEIIRDQAGNCDICGMPLVPAESLGFVRGDPDKSQPLLIPVSAVLITGPRAIVYVQVPNMKEPTFELREVKLGPRTTDHYIVLEGLEAGERVVVNGSFKIDSAMQIAAKPSMMMPQGGQGSRGHEHHGLGKNAETNPSAMERHDVPADMLASLDPLYAAYFDLQEALATDNITNARKSTRKLSRALNSITLPQTLDEKIRKRWNEIKEQLQTDLEHIDHWTDLSAFRTPFEDISARMISLEQHFGHSGMDMTYEVFCPMAFDNKGASWLQQGKSVNNPYFGTSMQRCGEVRKEFASHADLELN
ncbi:MAG: efflux RND transporter periplasmic adaptor subunit [Candidatus Marinimicrobia bacterium]|nr:efflux RND transporter periplasmic adaptor subunit [Candidatus Neomarinimicrobiota bacterium]MCF7851575.1 efflux RND transporter periplasmic adaptor subunit [Candidatus Neomarinimicrobiota bacterium]